MKELERRIIEDGIVINNDILKVDSFINHQIDVALVRKIAKDIVKNFSNLGINKILTIETSGIAYAYAVATEMNNIPLVFAKKSKSATVGDDVYTAAVKSFTRNTISSVTVGNKYLKPSDTVLIVDDFLAEGNASIGLIDLCNQAGAKVVGVAVAIEKAFQPGRYRLEEMGIKVYSCASIKAFIDNKPVF